MPYLSVAVEGGLFPVDLLDRIAAGDNNLPGQKVSDFGINGSRRITDEIQSAFSDARSYWDAFQRRLERSHESRTTITREDWVAKFTELLGFENLVVQRASAEVGSEKYFISHRSGDYPEAVPVHIVSIEQEIDRRDSSGRRSPHGLVQDYLNHSDALWGIVTNGKRLRLLRNLARLSKPTYLEFDIEGMLTGNLYSEFVLLYRLLHITRFPKQEVDAHECLLERYYQQGIDEGGRVREKLRDGVEEALRILGTAFLSHPKSEQLRGKLESKGLNASAYYRQLLHLVYRILFLMVAEERKLIFPVEEAATERQFIYARYYGIARLRERADRYFAGDLNIDLWLGLCQTFRILRDNEAAKKLGLSALNGELFSHLSCPDLEESICTNDALLKALRELSTFRDGSGIRRRVNYSGLDVEEFGSVYESLLDFHPQVALQPAQFDLVAGSERKQTGSYYTPPELVHELIESALVPVIQDRLRTLKTPEEQAKALLNLRVCDPASGSGHFLLAAARRIARELGTVRSNGQEPSPEEYRHALRDVIRTCVYAVDKNPLAVDLCKVALWIEGHSAGLPLSFLDHHIKCGDSLVGVADLKALDDGIPDGAYQSVLGDDKKAANYYKKRNQEEKKREHQLFMGESRPIARITENLAGEFEVLGTLEERSPDEVNAKEGLYDSLRRQDSDWWKLNVACDLWTAAFFMTLKQEDALHMEGAPTTGVIRKHLETNSAYPVLVGQAVATSQEHNFFHWELEFPDVFEHGGFDVLLGNPPFMGGIKISTNMGDHYRKYLNIIFVPATGLTDLCAYFFRLSYKMLRHNGILGMIATKTISQGDTREGGLAIIINTGGTISFAHRFIKWPGTANVEVNLIAIKKGKSDETLILDSQNVSFISSKLDQEPERKLIKIQENNNKSFIGCYVRGKGFVLEPQESNYLVSKDPKNKDCLFQYLDGADINASPEQKPTRWIICFQEWPLERARQYPDILSIVEKRVKPEREKVKQSHDKEYWWLFARLRNEMRQAISGLDRYLVRSRVSETHALTFISSNIICSDSTVIFAFNDFYHFALLQSSIHDIWLRYNASTLRTDITYSPEECFDTFSFPKDPSPDLIERSIQIGQEYYQKRQELLRKLNIGFTSMYNLFHNPDCHDPDVQYLRDLHSEMDMSVLACYNWENINKNYDFYSFERGRTRYTFSPEIRQRIVQSLIKLNLNMNSG